MIKGPVRGFAHVTLAAITLTATLAVSADFAEARRRPAKQPRPIAPVAEATPQRGAAATPRSATLWSYAHEPLFRDVMWTGSGQARARTAALSTAERADASGPQLASATFFSAVCKAHAEDLAAWPLEEIKALVRPTPEQASAIDQLRNNVAARAEKVRVACPTPAGESPPERITELLSGVAAISDALHSVRESVKRFYATLDEEQKARVLNLMFRGDYERGSAPEAPPRCESLPLPSALQAPVDELARALQPSPAQLRAVYGLSAAYVRAATLVEASCPRERSLTPMGRLDNLTERLNGVAQALSVLEPAVAQLYAELSDEQKSRLVKR